MKYTIPPAKTFVGKFFFSIGSSRLTSYGHSIDIRHPTLPMDRQPLTVDFAEREPIDDHPEVVQERHGHDHVPVVAQLASGVEHKRPPYALNAVGRPVSVLPGTAIFLPTTVEADGTASVVVRRPAGRFAASAPAIGPATPATRRRRCCRTGTTSVSGVTTAVATSAATVARASAGAIEVDPARTVLSRGRFAARSGRDVRIRAGYATWQTAACLVCVNRRQRVSGVGETCLRKHNGMIIKHKLDTL